MATLYSSQGRMAIYFTDTIISHLGLQAAARSKQQSWSLNWKKFL